MTCLGYRKHAQFPEFKYSNVSRKNSEVCYGIVLEFL